MSSTQVQSVGPKKRPISGAASGAMGGAAQGAAVGAAAGPVGMIAGAVIGGIAGGIAGGEADKSAYYKKMAEKWALQAKEREFSRNTIREPLRQYRMMRAQAMMGITNEAGGTRSSAPQGAVSSMGAQYGENYNYALGQLYIQRKYSKFMNKSKKAANAAQMIFSTMDSISSAASSFGGMGGSKPSWGGSGGVYAPTTGTGGIYNPPTTAPIGSSTQGPFSPPSR